MGRLAVNLLLASGAALLALLPGEIGLARSGLATQRLAMLMYLQTSYQPVHHISSDGVLHYALRPGATHQDSGPYGPFSIHINAHGARGPELPTRKGEGVVRILCFGPSTTFGAGVSDGETIPAGVGRRLAERMGQEGSTLTPEIWNFGTSAYVASQTARLAMRQMEALEPDVLVMLLANPGRRAFLAIPDHFNYDWRSWAAVDGWFWFENSLRPAWLPRRLHELLLARSALYLYWNAQRSIEGMGPETSNRLGDGLSKVMAAQLQQEAARRGVGLLVVSWRGEQARYYPGLKEAQYVDLIPDLTEAQRDRLETHPPAPILEEYGARVADGLLAAGLVTR